MSEGKFIPGFYVKEPHEKAPDFIKAKISMKREEVVRWLNGQNSEWVNLDIKRSREGKLYAQIDDWKPNSQEPIPEPSVGDDVPF